MEDQIWNLFRETGEPMGYLLYRAEKQKQQAKTAQTKEKPKPQQAGKSASA